MSMEIKLAPLRCYRSGDPDYRPERDRLLPSPREMFPDQFPVRSHTRSWTIDGSEPFRGMEPKLLVEPRPDQQHHDRLDLHRLDLQRLGQHPDQQNLDQRMPSPEEKRLSSSSWDQIWSSKVPQQLQQRPHSPDYTTGPVSPVRHSPTHYSSAGYSPTSYSPPRRYSPRYSSYHTQPRAFATIGNNAPPRYGADKLTWAAGENHRRRRGNHPRQFTSLLKAWYDEHYSHPYPSEEQKKQLMSHTGMTMTQISNWFINHRRRQGRNPPESRNAATGAAAAAAAPTKPRHHSSASMGSAAPPVYTYHHQSVSLSPQPTGLGWVGMETYGQPSH